MDDNAMLSPRSVLVARSTPSLSAGAIAGAVVGSVVGFAILLFCLFPFVVRIRRRLFARHDESAQAEMGQGPGGPIFAQTSDGVDLADSLKRQSKDHLVPAVAPAVEGGSPQDQSPPASWSTAVNGHGHGPEKAASGDDQHQPGLPSSTTSSSPTSTAPGTQATRPAPPASAPAPSPPLHSPSIASTRSRRETKGRDSTRELSLTDSYGSPSRQLTGFSSGGITEEPESFEHPGATPQRRFSQSLRNLLHRGSSSRRDSRRSTQVGTDGARSPSVLTNDHLVQAPAELTQPAFEIDTQARGEAWSYYHDPDLGSGLPDTYNTQPASLPAGLGVAPPSHLHTSVPLTPISPIERQPTSPGAGFAPPMTNRPVVEEPEAIPFDGEGKPTISKGPVRNLSREDSLLSNLRKAPGPGPLRRIDSLPPPTIVADIPSPPHHTGPSANPMEMMRPTTHTENVWALEQEILKIQNSPPPSSDPSHTPVYQPVASPVSDPAASPGSEFEATPSPEPETVPTPLPVFTTIPEQEPLSMHSLLPRADDSAYVISSQLTPEPDFHTPPYQSQFPSPYQTPYQSPPYQSPYQPALDIQVQMPVQFQQAFPQTESVMFFPNNGGATDLLAAPDYTTPPPSTGAPTEIATPDTRLTPYTASPSPPLEGDGLHPDQQAMSPKSFPCDQCHRKFDQIHKLNHHKRYHDRPHACPHQGCSMSFGTKTHLDRHINDKHNKTKKFHCTQHDCPYSRQGGKSFPRKDNWRRHMMNKHHITPDADPGAEFVDDIMGGT